MITEPGKETNPPSDLKSTDPAVLEAIRYWLVPEVRESYIKAQCDLLWDRLKDVPGADGDITVGKLLIHLGPAAGVFEGHERQLHRWVCEWYSSRHLAKKGPPRRRKSPRS